MNLNELAREISKLEGKKVSLSIAQIKEVLKCLGIVMDSLTVEGSHELVSRIVKAGKRSR